MQVDVQELKTSCCIEPAAHDRNCFQGILGALQTLYQVRSRCPGLLEFLASSPPQTLWVKDGVEWTPSAGHEGFQRKAPGGSDLFWIF